LDENTIVTACGVVATRNSVVQTYKIQWSYHDEGDTTWKIGEYLQEAYEDFYNKWFVTQNLGTRFL
jgi:hypothetical protein